MTELERQLAAALRSLSEQYGREQRNAAGRIDGLRRQAETLRKHVEQLQQHVNGLAADYGELAADYRRIANALGGRWRR